MLLDKNPELQLASRPKMLVISIGVHVLLLLLIALNPGWFDSTPKRTIRIAGEDFDLSQLEIQPLYLPPIRPAPAAPPPEAVPAPIPQAVQPPIQAAPPPPPPPPPQPPPPTPNQIIRPDDQLIEGARPDGSPRASRGNTPDPARNGNQAQQAREAQQAQEAQAAQEEQKARQAQTRGQSGNDRLLPNNTNPNALHAPVPNLLSQALRSVDDQFSAARMNGQGGRTGVSRSDNNGTFSTDSQVQVLSPNPKGIDFGPYLNQLLTRLRANWYSVMPEIARLGQKGRVDIVFSVTRSGNVKDVQVVLNSNYDALDKAAISAITLSNPFQHLPAEYETDLKLRIGFLYNMNP